MNEALANELAVLVQIARVCVNGAYYADCCLTGQTCMSAGGRCRVAVMFVVCFLLFLAPLSDVCKLSAVDSRHVR